MKCFVVLPRYYPPCVNSVVDYRGRIFKKYKNDISGIFSGKSGKASEFLDTSMLFILHSYSLAAKSLVQSLRVFVL